MSESWERGEHPGQAETHEPLTEFDGPIGVTPEPPAAIRDDGTAIEVGDVVYCEGSSAILGDVVRIESADEGRVDVVWRKTSTTEDVDDLILEGEER